MNLTLYVDGGARGNPGPAAAGVVLLDDDGKPVHRAGYYLGEATNNVAEYSGLIRGLEQGQALGASSITAFADSELMVKQINGQYRVKAEHLKGLKERAATLMAGFDKATLSHVRRNKNVDADALVNAAIDRRQDVVES
ncbi:MAG: ribonuclease HI family protein [Planctomycetota bacterium]